jgi:hypothetical protein
MSDDEEASEACGDATLWPDCSHCMDGTQHPLYVYMISTRGSDCVATDAINACMAYIGKSRHPLHRVCSHNRKTGYRVGAKITKSGAPNWQPELIIGPFFDGGASAYKELWRKAFRNVKRRLIGGVALATRYKLPMYVRDEATQSLIAKLLQEESSAGSVFDFSEEPVPEAVSPDSDTEHHRSDSHVGIDPPHRAGAQVV